jgi:hypothetical protein
MNPPSTNGGAISCQFIHSFYIPLIFTDVELVIYIASLVGKQVHTVALYCIITVTIADKIIIVKST